MRALVVGLGLIAQRHIRNIKALDASAEIAVWRQRVDPPDWRPPEGLPVDQYIYGAAAVREWGPDAAIICNPASMHVETAQALAGMPLFVEKPIADIMIDLATLSTAVAWRGQGCCYTYDSNPVLMIGYDLRFYRPLQLVKKAIDAGRIGRPLSIRCEVGQYLPDWRPGRDYRTSVSARRDLGGGVLLELSHEIDYARWLMGEVASVSAMMGHLSDLEIDVEDTADLLLMFESGALGSIHLDMVDRSPLRQCRVVGTEGKLVCDLLTGRVDHFYVAPGRLKWEVLHDGLTVIPDPLLEEMRHFLACCRGEAVPPVDGADAVRTLRVALAARRSAEERREVTC